MNKLGLFLPILKKRVTHNLFFISQIGQKNPQKNLYWSKKIHRKWLKMLRANGAHGSYLFTYRLFIDRGIFNKHNILPLHHQSHSV